MSLISQEIKKRNFLELTNSTNTEQAIWEENYEVGMFHLFLGLLLLFFGILLAPIGLIFLLPLILLCFYLPKKYVIKLTTSKFIVRKRLFGTTKQFQLYDLQKIEIIITKRKMYYHSESGTYTAILTFKLKIFPSIKDKTYAFTWIFHQRKKSAFGGYKEAKEKAIKKREAFEGRLQELEQIFPQLITYIDNYPIEKQLEHEKKMRQIMYSIFFLLILSSLLISSVKNEHPFAIISVIEFISLFYLIGTGKFNKSKDLPPEHANKSINHILKSILNGFIIFFFALILTNMIAYVLLFLLQSLVSFF